MTLRILNRPQLLDNMGRGLGYSMSARRGSCARCGDAAGVVPRVDHIRASGDFQGCHSMSRGWN
jgi:hypothetical protein